MSAGWIFVGLLFISPFCNAVEIQDKSPGNKARPRRSIMTLDSMVKEVTGRDGVDFINYGNWCGLGGSGKPEDPIDECCQNHDFCYDLAAEGVCRKIGLKGIYQLEYKWKTTSGGKISCENEEDRCKMTICMCDAVISYCLKSNLEFYDEQNLHKLSIFEMLREADLISS